MVPTGGALAVAFAQSVFEFALDELTVLRVDEGTYGGCSRPFGSRYLRGDHGWYGLGLEAFLSGEFFDAGVGGLEAIMVGRVGNQFGELSRSRGNVDWGFRGRFGSSEGAAGAGGPFATLALELKLPVDRHRTGDGIGVAAFRVDRAGDR